MYRLDTERLASLVRTRRGVLTLREAVEQIDYISPATLSRIERGSEPDLITFLALCDWLGVPPSTLIIGEEAPDRAGPIELAGAIRLAPFLERATAEAIARLVEVCARS